MAVAVKSWSALGTSVHVLTTNRDDLASAEQAVREIVLDVDAAYSRFRGDSELSRLQARGGGTFDVSPLLGKAIATALRAARLSDGAVDPTIGTAIKLAGYDDDFARVKAAGEPMRLRVWRVAGWQVVRYDENRRRVSMPAGVELDLGSTGKALAADLAAGAALAAVGHGGVLVSLGGDIAAAGVPPDGGWRILVSEDSRVKPDGDGQVICVAAGGVATSSTTVRRWTRGGATLHHIIDPSTGLPTNGPWQTVTVVAASCVDANIASTAAIVKGDAALEWLRARDLPARLTENDGTVHYVGPWPDPNEIAA